MGMIEKVIKRLEYCTENKCDICQEENGSGFPWIDGRCYGFTERLYDALALLKAQESIEARLHLCDSCTKLYPECDATTDGIEFGCRVGNDNIIGCTAYENRWKAQGPRVLTLEEVKAKPDYAWIEKLDSKKTYIVLFDFTTVLSDLSSYAHMWNNYGKDELLLLLLYNKTWRCWTSRPTDEQREAIPWKT